MTMVESTAEPATPTGTGHPVGRRRALVVGSRTVLLMLLVAAVVLLGLGAGALVRNDPVEADGWLRSMFGTVFGTMAVLLAAILGVPAAIGVWAMSGATADDARPALSARVRHLMATVALVTLGLTVVVVLALGSRVTILDVALMGLAALPTLGLAGAVAWSPHRARASLCAVTLVVLSAGMAWVLLQAYGVLAGARQS